jgi:hypothetical protein
MLTALFAHVVSPQAHKTKRTCPLLFDFTAGLMVREDSGSKASELIVQVLFHIFEQIY